MVADHSHIMIWSHTPPNPSWLHTQFGFTILPLFSITTKPILVSSPSIKKKKFMADIIQLLPDSIANQIAAGEVIQRPASVVKELVENAIDAGATQIKLIVKDAGKTLIQVIDNGKGMSDTDARMSFERHATSKIKKATDLFHIDTKGFRGEALASIAAIAQVELITKTVSEELGRKLVIEASTVKKQEPCQASTGSSFSVKNLFFNIPARRKFLKSDPVELRHITEEFKRVALAHPEVFFLFYHNGQEVYHLPATNHRQRIVGIIGKQINDKLVPVEEDTQVMKLTGFVGKPERAKKTKGDQFIFVNRRFIKSNYLNHAIRSAYDELIHKDYYPLFVIYLDIDPAQIDINVHPTKTEIKFEEERLIYNYVKVAVKHALGQYSIAPSLDFSHDSNFSASGRAHKQLDPLRSEYNRGSASGKSEFEKSNLQAWENLYDNLQRQPTETDSSPASGGGDSYILLSKISGDEQANEMLKDDGKPPYQVHKSYILSHVKSGMLLIDQQAAHERILYEDNLRMMEGQRSLTQKELFPRTIQLDPGKGTMLYDMLDKVNALGFEVEHFGDHTFLIHGVPASMAEGADASMLVEQLVDQYADNVELQLGIDENLARSLATSAAIKRGKQLSESEMKSIIDQLFACDVPYKSPNGRKCYTILELDDIAHRFID